MVASDHPYDYGMVTSLRRINQLDVSIVRETFHAVQQVQPDKSGRSVTSLESALTKCMKQATLSAFRSNTYEKLRGGATRPET